MYTEEIVKAAAHKRFSAALAQISDAVCIDLTRYMAKALVEGAMRSSSEEYLSEYLHVLTLLADMNVDGLKRISSYLEDIAFNPVLKKMELSKAIAE